MAKKEFIELRRKQGITGSSAQYTYIYSVNGHEVWIEVSATVLSRWNISLPDIKEGIEIFIETRMKDGWSIKKSNHLVLDELGAMPIAQRLGWRAARR